MTQTDLEPGPLDPESSIIMPLCLPGYKRVTLDSFAVFLVGVMMKITGILL